MAPTNLLCTRYCDARLCLSVSLSLAVCVRCAVSVHLSYDNFVKKEKWNYMFMSWRWQHPSLCAASFRVQLSLCSVRIRRTQYTFMYISLSSASLYSYMINVSRACAPFFHRRKENILKTYDSAVAVILVHILYWVVNASEEKHCVGRRTCDMPSLARVYTNFRNKKMNEQKRIFHFNSIRNLHSKLNHIRVDNLTSAVFTWWCAVH